MTLTDPTTAPAPEQTTPVVAAPVRTLGIVSLVLGIAGIASGFNVVLGAAAIVIAILAYRQEPASRSFATAGIVTGAVSVATITLGIGAFFAAIPFFGLLGAWSW